MLTNHRESIPSYDEWLTQRQNDIERSTLDSEALDYEWPSTSDLTDWGKDLD